MKKKKVRVGLLIGVLVLWSVFLATDYTLAKSNESPVFSVLVRRYKDGGSTEYYGLGYKVIKYVDLNVENGPSVTKVDMGSWFMKFSRKSEEEIREIAYEWLDNSSKITVLNFENAKVEKYKYDNEHIVASKSEQVDLKDKDTYRVIFNNKDEELLGTINVYLDANNFEVLGTDFRE